MTNLSKVDNQKNNMKLFGVVAKEQIISINEATQYAYYSTLMLLLKTKGSVKNVRLFRYKSIGESALWSEHLREMSPQRILFLYAFFDEMTATIHWYNDHIRNQTTVNKSKNLAFTARLSIIGHMANRILKQSFFDIFQEFGPGGDALKSLLILANDMAESGRGTFFWNEDADESFENTTKIEDMHMYMHGVVKIFEQSDFVFGNESFLQKVSSLMEIIEKEELLKRFFSIKDVIFQNLVDHSKAEHEISKYIIFFKRVPVWVDATENNSFFSFLFSDMLDNMTKEYILTLEYLRIYLSTGKGEKQKIKDSSFSYMMKLLMDRNNSNFSNFSTEFKELSSILLSGGDIVDQRAFFAFTHNKKTIELYKIDIIQIVDSEGAHISLQIKNLKTEKLEPSEEELKGLTKLFFINVFEKIEEFLLSSGGIVYEDLNDKDMTRLSLVLSSIIKSRIPKIIKLGGIFDE